MINETEVCYICKNNNKPILPLLDNLIKPCCSSVHKKCFNDLDLKQCNVCKKEYENENENEYIIIESPYSYKKELKLKIFALVLLLISIPFCVYTIVGTHFDISPCTAFKSFSDCKWKSLKNNIHYGLSPGEIMLYAFGYVCVVSLYICTSSGIIGCIYVNVYENKIYDLDRYITKYCKWFYFVSINATIFSLINILLHIIAILTLYITHVKIAPMITWYMLPIGGITFTVVDLGLCIIICIVNGLYCYLKPTNNN
jgi:hypothetical protein